ncbi:hypothetical protein Bca101_035640 [Brassica carinata]
MSCILGTKEIHVLLGHLLISYCVLLLSKERHMALRLGACSFAMEDSQAQVSIMDLVEQIEIGSIGYHTALSRIYLYRNRVCVVDDKLLRKEILQQTYHSCFSTHREHQRVQKYEELTIIGVV